MINSLKSRTPILAVILSLFVIGYTYAANKAVVIPVGGDDAPSPTVYEIGDEGPGGGIVFHVTNDGFNGLEAAPVDQAPAPWNCWGTDVAGVDNIQNKVTPDSHSGAANTPLIAVACPGDQVSAAVLAAVYVWPNGQTDGFLPNKEELNLLFAQKNVVGALDSANYWSSSESGNNLIDAWNQDFNGQPGVQFTNSKNFNNGVRPVRAF